MYSCHCRIQGGARDAHPLSVQFHSCSFQQNNKYIRPSTGVGAPVWEILDPPRNVTHCVPKVKTILRIKKSTYFQSLAETSRQRRTTFGTTRLLFIAARNKNLKNMNILLDHGADVNVKDSMNETPLFPAVELGCIDMVKRLVEVSEV